MTDNRMSPETFRFIRLRLGLTQKQLGTLLECSMRQIGAFERNEKAVDGCTARAMWFLLQNGKEVPNNKSANIKTSKPWLINCDNAN